MLQKPIAFSRETMRPVYGGQIWTKIIETHFGNLPPKIITPTLVTFCPIAAFLLPIKLSPLQRLECNKAKYFIGFHPYVTHILFNILLAARHWHQTCFFFTTTEQFLHLKLSYYSLLCPFESQQWDYPTFCPRFKKYLPSAIQPQESQKMHSVAPVLNSFHSFTFSLPLRYPSTSIPNPTFLR